MPQHAKPNNLQRTRWQEPKPKLRKRQDKSSIWEARYRRDLPDGTVEQPREALGDKTEFPTEAALKSSPKWKAFCDRINTIRTAVYFSDLCRLYCEEEIKQRCPHGQVSAKGQLWYLEDKWGSTRLDQLIQQKYEIKSWLQGDLPLRSDPERQASRQTRKHLRTLLVMMLTYAVDKHYLPYNPFTGAALAVKKGGAMPVDRSEFFIDPDQFDFMQNDPDTPGHVKMMMLLAYTAGMRIEEILALKWDEIDFDGPEPKIKIVRVVDGKHIRESAKTEHSKAPVPMCDRLGAALLYYRDQYPLINGWLFGSIQTGRPLWDDALRQNYLRPALLRMAAKFKLKGVPDGTGFHAFRHAFNALIITATGSAEEVKAIQMKLLRHGDKATNDRYGKSAKPVRDQARIAQAVVSELAMGGGIN